MAAKHRSLTIVQRSFSPLRGNLGHRVVGGAGFTMLGIVIRTLLTIGSMSILARLLTPADFGHVAMATVVMQLAGLFASFGFGSILIQRSRIGRIDLDTTFWASLGLGVLLSLAVFALSFFSGLFFAEPVSGDLLKVMCLAFLLEGVTVVPNSIMARMMMFREEFYVRLVTLLFSSGSAILFAWQGFGVWSLVLSALVGGVAQWLAFQWYVRYLPRLRFSLEFFRATWRINGSYFGNGLLFFLNMNADIALVGRMLGAVSLGYYQNARSLTDEIRARIAIPLQRVLFPAFSMLKEDPGRLQDAVMRSARLLALVVVPVGCGVAVVAEELVAVLYGDQWLPMIPILQVISIGSALRAATAISTSIFNSMNQVGLSFRLNLVATTMLLGALLIGSQWGLMGVAIGQLVAALFSVALLWMAFALIGLRMRHLLQVLGVPGLAAAVMYGIVYHVRLSLPAHDLSVFLQLPALVLTGAAAYALSVSLISRAHLRDLRDLLARFRKRPA